MQGWPFIWLGFQVIRSKCCIYSILIHFDTKRFG
jgi:hypothetical protein